ncbi:MAG TPA: MmgE/PrpD family protein [Burkholderiales bacterium]|nr:MmgE/PrpD family protein [Burkholderiales bacterium]
MSTRPDLVNDFADLFARTRYDTLPPAAIDAAKKSILDTLGVILAASGVEPAVRGVVDLVRESGGPPESSVLGFGGRASAVMAGLANGAMAHCLDYDDRTPEGHHPSSSIVPAAFAVAERKGGVSGREMIAAVAAGQDMFIRLRRNVGWKQDFHLTTVIGIYAAAGAAARVLGLSREQILNAFGIASMQSCGLSEMQYGVGTDLRGMYAGFVTHGAVLAALLAKKGVGGIQTLFEGKAGVFNVYFDGEYDREKMLRDLGSEYTGAYMLYKPWPACGVAFTYIHATLQLMKEHRLRASDIAQIRVHVGDYQYQLCVPFESRRAPTTLVDAKFSIPFCVAVAAARQRIGIAEFTSDALEDREILAIAQKVVAVQDSRYDWKMTLPDGRVEIVTHDGRTLDRIGSNAPGDESDPLTWDQLVEKFRDCASFAAIPLSTDKITRAQNMARNLESLDDATELLRVLS